MQEKKNILTYEGLRKYEDELHDLKVVKRQEVAQKIKEAREQGDLSENAEYDAAKDEQRDIEARIEELETGDSEIDETMVLPDVCTNVAECTKLSREKADIAEELEELYEKWVELA